ncbi:uncharacterized protein LOC121853788 isoform X3 [Homarus americanus]|uniref:uncharacterized protein LOC121853788 isoform X3 n=1 Tax=Homarus americanus TaxID=6706 RepID=UPI001C496942|nr:uncharacterized protein LOC121853788 isoform X3 [Homarus americanus]
MNRTLLHVLGALLLSSCVLASDFPFADLSMDQAGAKTEADPRLFFVFSNLTTGSFVTFNTTLLLFSAGILLWGIAGAIALYYLLTAPADSGSGYSGYDSGSGSGYSGRSNRGSFDPYAIDWEKFSILDWIAIGEEAWRKFDPSDLECQKRLICEVHQNTSRFGNPAARIVDLFSYLQYAEVLSLPDEFKALIEEYNDAADRGRSLQKDCGEVYTTCDFSVKKIMDKYSHNEV